MKNVKLFQDFVNESVGDYGNVNDPFLSTNPFKKHQSDVQQQFARMQGILSSVFNIDPSGFGRQIDLDFEVNDLTIIRVYPNGAGSLDVYLKFHYQDIPYYGIFKNWGSVQGATLQSSFMDAIRFNRENRIKFEGIIRRVLTEWFKPSEGIYTSLKDEVKCIDDMGTLLYIPKGGKVEIEDVYNEGGKPVIYINYKEHIYYISDNDYYYFHWWFENTER